MTRRPSCFHGPSKAGPHDYLLHRNLRLVRRDPLIEVHERRIQLARHVDVAVGVEGLLEVAVHLEPVAHPARAGAAEAAIDEGLHPAVLSRSYAEVIRQLRAELID